MPKIHHIISHFFSAVPARLRGSLSTLFTALKRAKRGDRILAVFLLVIWLFIIFGFFLRGNQPFEGSFIVSELSFTYAGDREKLFLNTIKGIKNLEIQGRHKQILTLTGKFSSSEPLLDQKLRRLKKLDIQLPYPYSHIILGSRSLPKSSELSILSLQIHPESEIVGLTYASRPSQLSFCLQGPDDLPGACLSPESLSESAGKSNLERISRLILQLGQQPLSLNFADVNIPDLDIQPDSELSDNQSIQFIPEISELALENISPTKFFIDLFDAQEDAKDWLWKNIDVRNVRFSREERELTGNEIFESSTILEGKVRLRGQLLEVQPDQFFIVLPVDTRLPFGEKPGIKKLRYIKVVDRPSQGLRISFFGQGTGIAVGLYPGSPVQIIEPAWLSQYLSPEAINAILGFITAFTAILLPRLFPEVNKKHSSDDRQTPP